MSHDVVIIGAGMTGLTAARTLSRRGLDVKVLEAGTAVGGRVRTDEVDGFLLDHGFQILLTAYPDARTELDYAALDLRRFEPGALVRIDGRFCRVADPLRKPGRLVETATAPIGTVADKLRLAKLIAQVRSGHPRKLLRGHDGSTLEALRREGFSEHMIESFWRPLFAGIQLDPNLDVTERRFAMILRMLAEGDSVVPARGMQRIPEQLAADLPEGSIEFQRYVDRIEDKTAVLTTGERVTGRALIVATDGPAAARLTGLPDPGSRSVTCLYFAAEDPPILDPVLVLDGDRSGPVKNLAVMSNVSPAYAPPGWSLIAATVPGHLITEHDGVVADQLVGWFGPIASRWQHLRSYRIHHGHPDQRAPFNARGRVDFGDGRFICGDHRDTASIQGAIHSGLRTSQAVLEHLHGPIPNHGVTVTDLATSAGAATALRGTPNSSASTQPSISVQAAVATEQKVSVSRVIAAAPETIFAIVDDPAQHAAMDGGTSVLDSRVGSRHLNLGDSFSMDMKMVVPYRMSSKVVEYERDRLIAWAHFGKHRWRYELEPVVGGTKVTETFDWSTSFFAKGIELMKYPTSHPLAMARTLENLERLALAAEAT